MSSSSLNDNLERFDQMVEKAQRSVDYWVTGPIVEFTEDICRLMDEQGVSRADLARRLGTSRAYVTKLLGGNANFTLETMTKVAMALGAAVHVHVADQNAVVRWQTGDRPASTVSEAPAGQVPRKTPKRRPRRAPDSHRP